MKYINSDWVNSFFNMMNASELRYVLLKNANDALPHKLPLKKSINILVHPDNRLNFFKLMKKNGYFNNPFYGIKRSNGYIFLYPMNDGDCFIKNKMNIEVFYQLNIHAMQKGYILPLDKKIQVSVWDNKVFNHDKSWWELGGYDLLTYLIVRSIFDKHNFSDRYIEAIEQKKYLLHDKEVLDRLSLIVFKFAPRLVELIEQAKYSQILNEYIGYSEY